jgi:alpha-tubulin suppressor-like RCC1 family protein
MIKDVIVAAQKTPPVPPVYFNEVWTVGNNGQGELGTNESIFARSSPVQVGTDTNWSIISANNSITYAIKADGTLWAWGDNSQGALGDNTTISRSSPVQIGPDVNWALVNYALALKSDGTIWTWGRNVGGILGVNDTINRSSPVQIGTDTNWYDFIKEPFVVNNRAAIKTDGTLWGWGDSTYLGLSRDNTKADIVYGNIDKTPIRSYSSVAMGQFLGYAIGFDGTLWGWGHNANFMLGDGTSVDRTLPVQIGTATDWSKVSAGDSTSITVSNHKVGIKTDGTLWGWGLNNFGQLGLLDVTSRSIPTQIGPDTNWKEAVAGNSFTIAIKTNGTLWSWGTNTNGVLGLLTAATAHRSSPVQIGTRSDWTQISSGTSHTIAIRSDGTLWAWGNGSLRQLGITTTFTGNRSSPTQVGVRSNWTQIATGRSHSMGVASDGTLWAWGGNVNGQLGISTATGRSSPVQVGTRSNWSQVRAGSSSTFGIQTDGTLWAWGFGTQGELGLGTLVTRSSPTQVGTLTNWVSASMGTNHSGVMDNNGIIYTAGDWGTFTSNSKLGIGRLVVDDTIRSSPVQIGTDSNWSKFSGQGMVLRKTDGTEWAFQYRSSPVQIGTDTNWATISADAGVPKFGIKTDGTLWRWTSSTLTSYSQSFGADTNWKTLSYSGNGPYAFFTKTDNTLWFWGSNSNGQGGLGDTIYRSSPIQVGNLSSWISASAGIDHSAAIKRYT